MRIVCHESCFSLLPWFQPPTAALWHLKQAWCFQCFLLIFPDVIIFVNFLEDSMTAKLTDILNSPWGLFETCFHILALLMWSAVHLHAFAEHKSKPMHYLHLFRHRHHCWVTVQLWDSFKEKTQLLTNSCDNSSYFYFISRFFCALGTLLSCKCCSEERLFFQRLWRVKAVKENKRGASSVGSEIFLCDDDSIRHNILNWTYEQN